MIPVDEARVLVRARAGPLAGRESVPLADALGRVLAAPIVADRDDPPFARAQMDGWALRAADTPGTLAKTGDVHAGDPAPAAVEPGCAVWINTGAPVPPGADTVVPVERTTGAVTVPDKWEAGANILARGELAAAGDVVLDGVLGPEGIGVCAAVGADPVAVRRRPRVALLATGTELSGEPGAHEIRNSNGPTLRALCAGCAVTDLGVAPDDRDALTDLLRAGLAHDALLTTGGVSKGTLDLVRPCLEALDVEIVFHGVALQPGKPCLFGVHGGGVVFGLPGNPASAVVCAELFALPWLAAVWGRSFDHALRRTAGRLTADAKASPKRRRVFPCRLVDGAVTPLPWRSSADLYTLVRGNAYLVLEPGADRAAGDEIECLVPERSRA